MKLDTWLHLEVCRKTGKQGIVVLLVSCMKSDAWVHLEVCRKTGK